MKKGLKQSIRTVIFLFLAILLLWVSFRDINFNNLWLILKKANYLWLLPAAGFTIIGFFIRARRWIILIEPLDHKPGLKNTYHSVVTGYFANLVFPRLGEITKCATLSRKESIPFDKLVGTMLVERTIDIFSVMLFLGLMLSVGSTTTGIFLSQNVFDMAGEKISSAFGSPRLIFILMFLLAIAVVILYFKLRNKLSSQPFFRKIYSFGDGIVDGLKTVARLKRKWEFIFLTVLLWFVYLFMSFFPLLCLRSTAGLGMEAAVFILLVGSLGMSAPVQSGLGAYHWIVSRGLLAVYAIPLEEGLAYATLSHESQILLIAVHGAISIFVLFGRKGGKVLAPSAAETKA